MLSRRALEHSALYQRSRELELRLEHVMAMLLPVPPAQCAAFALYRDRRRPFSEKDSAMLTSFARHMVNMVRNCRDMQVATSGVRLLEELHGRDDAAFIVVSQPSREVLRSRRAATLFEKWFTPSDLHASGIPEVLHERLVALPGMDADSRLDASLWVSLHGDTYRAVRFIELPAEGDAPRQWALVLYEIPVSIPLPEVLRRQLTARQTEIAKGVLRNWSNRTIANELRLSEETVKTHMGDIFERLSIDSRLDLFYQATYLNRPI
ncbi:helix-turn-helix transcriptional regulator [Myxococcus sp. K15C18031901]|uniref:helix-turn-helix domain-containing protein n=1 Tax=Myxococcus dinghuensis TaxID=2906761 RepID=UPI0020A775C8|nr:helix-turn-helix transcriptional regulator [Myxococcus dinghuensis]MCP3097304.1 helix-turn-helix transcriptional regulator [Myxococcus dinghuensis]